MADSETPICFMCYKDMLDANNPDIDIYVPVDDLCPTHKKYADSPGGEIEREVADKRAEVFNDDNLRKYPL